MSAEMRKRHDAGRHGRGTARHGSAARVGPRYVFATAAMSHQATVLSTISASLSLPTFVV